MNYGFLPSLTNVTADPLDESLDDFIQRIGRDEADLIKMAVRSALENRLSPQEPSTLSEQESQFLDKHSGTKPNPAALANYRLSSDIARSIDRATALNVSTVADMFGVSPSRVRHRIRQRTIYAYPTSGPGVERRIPEWQFVDGKEVPGLGEVLSALPEDMTPLDVKAFVMNARVDHPTDEQTFGLLEWLLNGGDVSAAVELAVAQNYSL